MQLDAVEDINEEENQTNTTNQLFKDNIKYFKKLQPKSSSFVHCRNAILKTFMYDWLNVVIIAIISEGTGIYYAFFIQYLAQFIMDKNQPITKGIWLIVIYLCLNFVCIIFRNRYISYGYMISIRMRRTLCAVMFDKVTALSVESLAKTNSGKLIAMISSDLFAVERTFTFAPLILVSPICNLFTFLYIGSMFGWIPALIVIGCILVSFGLQILAGNFQKSLKTRDAQ